MQFFIFCSDTDLNGAALENITVGEWTTYNACTKVWYADHEKISDSLVKQVEAIKPNVLYIIGIYSWHFNIVPLIYCKAPRKILSTRGMLHPGALSQKKWKKKIYLRLFKLLEYHHKVAFHATDEEEHKFISDYFGKVPLIFTAKNFPNKLGGLPVANKEKGQLKLISIAIISPMKNILLVLKALEKMEDEIQYDIYGPVKDHDYWMLCKEQIKLLPGNVSVSWHGDIPPGEVAQALSGSHVFILPSKSENFGHAIYEALSAGRPVITSAKTPWNGLRESFAGLNISLENIEDMREAIVFFASMDENQMAHWSHNSIKYAEQAIDPGQIKMQYRKMFFNE